jgi:AcrR family transcriptional regulator
MPTDQGTIQRQARGTSVIGEADLKRLFSERDARRASRSAILEAAGELLVTDGLVAVTLDAVARRAAVDRQAIGRWWPSEEALAVDVLHHEWKALVTEIRSSALRMGLEPWTTPDRGVEASG